jgi:hypothetical protein
MSQTENYGGKSRAYCGLCKSYANEDVRMLIFIEKPKSTNKYQFLHICPKCGFTVGIKDEEKK